MKNKHKTDANDNKNKYSKSGLNFKWHDKHKSTEKKSLIIHCKGRFYNNKLVKH